MTRFILNTGKGNNAVIIIDGKQITGDVIEAVTVSYKKDKGTTVSYKLAGGDEEKSDVVSVSTQSEDAKVKTK